MSEIDIAVVEKLAEDFDKAIKKCPCIIGVRLGSEGFEPIIIVDINGNASSFHLIVDTNKETPS